MTEGDVEVGIIYYIPKFGCGTLYKKISASVTVVCDESGTQIGGAENVHPFDEITPWRKENE